MALVGASPASKSNDRLRAKNHSPTIHHWPPTKSSKRKRQRTIFKFLNHTRPIKNSRDARDRRNSTSLSTELAQKLRLAWTWKDCSLLSSQAVLRALESQQTPNRPCFTRFTDADARRSSRGFVVSTARSKDNAARASWSRVGKIQQIDKVKTK